MPAGTLATGGDRLVTTPSRAPQVPGPSTNRPVLRTRPCARRLRDRAASVPVVARLVLSIGRRAAGPIAALAALGALLSASGCSEQPSTAEARRAVGVYAPILRWFATVEPQEDHGPPVLFVTAAEGASPLDLEVQAGLLSDVDDAADLRFVDEAEEAFDTDTGEIREDAILLVELGPVPTQGSRVEIDAVASHRPGNGAPLRFLVVEHVDDEWELVAEPERTPGEGAAP